MQCKTNGNVTRLSALAASVFPKKDARTIMRYTNSIMHIYYFIMADGGMGEHRWDTLRKRGMLTDVEITQLQRQGSPGVVLYAW